MEVLKSELDRSVNFITSSEKGFIESRYVRRAQDYFVAYLSSQTGCNRGCKFCHLTTTNQTSYVDVLPGEFRKQANRVLQHYINHEFPAREVNYNFMARGEPLANKHIINNAYGILSDIGEQAIRYGVFPKFNISTIIPRTLRKPLIEIFPIIHPTIYYSLYSLNPEFRAKWLPGAKDPYESLDLLADYQQTYSKIIKFHWALIENENDDLADVEATFKAVTDRRIHFDFNLVRYNPYSSEQGVESGEDKIKEVLEYISTVSGSNVVKKISRVGFDVKASCGMFIESPWHNG